MEAPAKTRIAPTEIAPETFLIHDHQGEGTAPVIVALNTLVIRAAEPVVVDTGMAENREQYLADVFGLVEPRGRALGVPQPRRRRPHRQRERADGGVPERHAGRRTGSWSSAWPRRWRSR